jgi:uncharacterized membrane protein
MIAGTIALIAASLFAGGALHVSVSEQPARLALPEQSKLMHWKGSFTRALRMAPPLALAGFFFGALAWWQTGNLLWIAGALLVGLNVPFTLLFIEPTNRSLLATDDSKAGPASGALVARWGRLHNVRTVLALAAIAVMAWPLVG